MKDYEALFTQIERAVDDHLRLRRVADTVGLHVSRLGFTAEIAVKLKGSRKRVSKISGSGDTADEATKKLIESLDLWAEAIK